jgi:hypothetical protein
MADVVSELSKLTVVELRALCKDRGVTGYSKLSKSRLLQKLATPPVISLVVESDGLRSNEITTLNPKGVPPQLGEMHNELNIVHLATSLVSARSRYEDRR